MLDKDLILKLEAAYMDASRMKPGELKQWKREQRLLDDAFRNPIQARGYLSRNDEHNGDELLAIVDWKAAKQKGNAGKNPSQMVERHTKEAFSLAKAGKVEEAVRWLAGLFGVSVRMASAIRVQQARAQEMTDGQPPVFSIPLL